MSLYLEACNDAATLEKMISTALPPPVDKTLPLAKGERRFDPRNTLNDLSGAEWLYFLRSVESTAFSTKGAGSFSHNLRKVHPSPKPPQLMRTFVEFFSKKGGWVLDPFMGVGGTLLGSALCERKAVGVDLDIDYIKIYKQVCEAEEIALQHSIQGDSREIKRLIEHADHMPVQFDLILTDPPYGDMLSRARTGETKKRTGNSDATPFTESEQDLGNLNLADFLDQLRFIIGESVTLLKPKGYCVVFCKDLQPNAQHHNMLHADVVETLLKIEGLSFKGYKIWHDKTPALYPFGYPFAFVSNQLHQFALIFRKEVEKPKQVKRLRKSDGKME